MKKRQAGSQFASVTAVFFSFLLAMLLLVILGSSSYRDTVAGMEGNQAARAGRAYLLTKLRSGDQAGMVAVETGAAGDVLVLSERAEDEVFETRIYLANGNLVEEYLPAGEGGDPSLAPVSYTHLDVYKRQRRRRRWCRCAPSCRPPPETPPRSSPTSTTPGI